METLQQRFGFDASGLRTHDVRADRAEGRCAIEKMGGGFGAPPRPVRLGGRVDF